MQLRLRNCELEKLSPSLTSHLQRIFVITFKSSTLFLNEFMPKYRIIRLQGCTFINSVSSFRSESMLSPLFFDIVENNYWSLSFLRPGAFISLFKGSGILLKIIKFLVKIDFLTFLNRFSNEICFCNCE